MSEKYINYDHARDALRNQKRILFEELEAVKNKMEGIAKAEEALGGLAKIDAPVPAQPGEQGKG